MTLTEGVRWRVAHLFAHVSVLVDVQGLKGAQALPRELDRIRDLLEKAA